MKAGSVSALRYPAFAWLPQLTASPHAWMLAALIPAAGETPKTGSVSTLR